MIEVINAKSYRCCNCCGSNKNVIEIYFRMNGQGTGIALCEYCAKSLLVILEQKYKEIHNPDHSEKEGD